MSAAERALPILERNGNGRSGYSPNAAAMTELTATLSDERISSLPVAVISVAGAMRTGKSTLLCFFLMALRWMELGRSLDEPNWTQQGDFSDGFHWQAGQQHDTTGILIWSRPFIILDNRGKKIAVLLVDTQGSFDTSTDMNDCAAVFAFSTLLASTQIFNIRGMVDENALQYLDVFASFGVHTVPQGFVYQNLIMLVRDWCLSQRFGLDGGRDLKQERLTERPTMATDQREMRNRINRSFQNIDFFLMPSPGTAACQGQWRMDDLDPNFSPNLQQLILQSLSTTKSINGQTITCAQLMDFVQPFLRIFDRNGTPQVLSMFNAMKAGNNGIALQSAIEFFRTNFEVDFHKDGASMADQTLRARAVVILMDKMMDAENSRQELLDKLNAALNEIVKRCQLAAEAHNASVIDDRFKAFVRSIESTIANTNVNNTFPVCRMSALTGLEQELHGGPDFRKAAMEKLESLMEGERRRIEEVQASQERTAQAEAEVTRAQEAARQADLQKTHAEDVARQETERRIATEQSATQAAMQTQLVMDVLRESAEQRVQDAERAADRARQEAEDARRDAHRGGIGLLGELVVTTGQIATEVLRRLQR